MFQITALEIGPDYIGDDRPVKTIVTDYQVVCKILKHLDVWNRSPPPAPAKSLIHEKLVYEPFDDGWPGYEDPLAVVQ